MKRLARAFLLSIMMLLVISNVAYAAWEYYFPTHVRDTSAAGRTYYPVLLGYGGQALVDSGKIAASGLDTNMQVGTTSIKYMMSTTNVTAVLPNLPASSTVTANLYTGYTPNQTGFPIIVGDSGSILTSDAAALEPGDTFEFEWDGYVDTSAGSNKNLVYKKDAFRTYISGATDVTAEVLELGGAAFPTVAAVNGGNNNSDATNHTVNLPSGITQWDLLLVFFSTDGIDAITFPAGWTQLYNAVDSGGADIRNGSWYRVAAGTESSTITVTTAGAQRTAHTSFRITGYYGLPEAGAAVGGAGANPDPPNLAPSWGARNTLWIAAVGYDDGTTTVNAYSAGYGNTRTDRSDNIAGVAVATARRNLNAAAENPGTYTLSAGEWTVANTVAIAPITAVTSVTATGVASGEHVVTVTQANPILNAGYETGDPPDNWTVQGAGATLVRSNAQVYSGSWSGLATRNGANVEIWQDLPNPTSYQSESITFGQWVYATVANRARLALWDGIGGRTNGSYHTGAAGWEYLTVTRSFGAAAATFRAIGAVDNGDTSVYFDDAYFISSTIAIDSVVQDRSQGATVTGNANNWYWMTGNSMPYADSITYDVSGAEVIRYAPASMLTATTLPDLTGAAQNGTITWGSNTSVTISYGAMETYESTYASSALVGGFEVPEVGLPDTWFASGANIPNLMFYDTFKMVSDESGMPVQTMYFAIVVGLALTAFLLIATYTRSALAGSLSMLIVLFIGSSQTIVPMWIPFALLIIQVAIMYLYRQVAY